MGMRTQGVIVLLASLIFSLSSADLAEASRATAASYVQRLDLQALQRGERSLPPHERELIGLYMECAKRDVLRVTDGCYPKKGVGTHWRNLAERAKGAAILSSFNDYWPAELRARCRRQAKEWVGEIAQEFRRHPNFKNEWQAAYWASEAAIAAWFLWDDLDEGLQETVAEMLVHQADRFVGIQPKMGYKSNTQAETVSWNSTVCTLAVNMMPDHPHREAWDFAAKQYVYNTFAAPQDARNGSIGDDGKPVRDWIVGANIYEDFALENHGQFHIDYIFACYRFHIQGAALYWLMGRSLPRAFHHHARDVYERVMLRCMNHERFFIYVSDNDWRRYHNWTESCALHAYLGLMDQHRLAYSLEAQALRNAVRYWRSFPEGFSYDNEYVCGKAWTSRIADAVLLHVTCPQTRPNPLSEEMVESQVRGTFELKSAQLLTHYGADGSFRSYGRGRSPAWVRFVAPWADSWMLLPREGNLGGSADGKPLLQGRQVHSSKGEDWFWVVRHDQDGHAAEAFISLPDEFIVFLERVSADRLTDVTMVENRIAVEKPHCRFVAHFEQGASVYEPGEKNWQGDDGIAGPVVSGEWVNLQDRIGFVYKLNGEDAASEILLPQAGARSAIRFRGFRRPGRNHGVCIVVCPNQVHASTRRVASQLTLSEKDAVTSCRLGRYLVAVNFGTSAAAIIEFGPSAAASDLLKPWQVAVWRDEDRLF